MIKGIAPGRGGIPEADEEILLGRKGKLSHVSGLIYRRSSFELIKRFRLILSSAARIASSRWT
jgi:hypothetical protein